MTYPCHLPEPESWSPAGKLESLGLRARLQRSTVEKSPHGTAAGTSAEGPSPERQAEPCPGEGHQKLPA